MIRYWLLFPVFTIFCSAGVYAAPRCSGESSSSELACIDPKLKTLNTQIARQMQALNRRIESNSLSKGTVAADHLRESQVAWERFRFNVCQIEGVTQVGANEWLKVRAAECELRLGRIRLRDLRNLEKALE